MPGLSRQTSIAGLCVAAIVTLAACSTSAPVTPPRPQPALETVLSWYEEDGALVVRVPSNGCTSKDSFDPVVTGGAGGSWSFQVRLNRVRPDNCRTPFPQGMLVSWTREELGIPPSGDMRLQNPIRARTR